MLSGTSPIDMRVCFQSIESMRYWLALICRLILSKWLVPSRVCRSAISRIKDGIVDRGAVVRHYQQGATIILPHLHRIDDTLAEFCRALEERLCSRIQTNAYLTPPDSQGFRTHYDDHDVFIVQVSGEKNWKFYSTPIENPYRGERFQSDVHEAGDPVHEFLLQAGGAYFPRGLMHDAVATGSEPSLHITVGVIVKTWADLMLEAVSEVALREPQFRRSLPYGFARDDYV